MVHVLCLGGRHADNWTINKEGVPRLGGIVLVDGK